MSNRHALFMLFGTLFMILVALLLMVAYVFAIPVLSKGARSPDLLPYQDNPACVVVLQGNLQAGGVQTGGQSQYRV